MIKLSVSTGVEGQHGTIPVEFGRFPCGERNLRLEGTKQPEGIVFDQVSISLVYEADNDLIDLLLLVDAVKRCPWLLYKNLVLLVNYFPYGRQDRVCNTGEPHSLKVIATLINSCGFNRVYVVDPHSDVIEALLDNVEIITMDHIVFAADGGPFTECDAYVSPDGGAYKKVSKAGQVLGKPIIRADKIRDTMTGALSDFEVYIDDLTGNEVVILDDICDGGGTFIGLAKKLREKGAAKVTLYVTHGMFTKGVKILLESIDEVWCYQYNGPDEDRYLVNQVELFLE